MQFNYLISQIRIDKSNLETKLKIYNKMKEKESRPINAAGLKNGNLVQNQIKVTGTYTSLEKTKI